MFKIFVVALSMGGQIVGFGHSQDDYKTAQECAKNLLPFAQQVVAAHAAKGEQVVPRIGCMPREQAVEMYKKLEAAAEKSDAQRNGI